ncbi:mitochondrial distribution and morphology family 33, partial [Fistulina hepatica ATCC 64428]
SKIQQALVATRHHLREWSEQAAIQARLRADDFTASTKKTFAQLGAELNKVTGYEEIEVLKRRVVDQERQIEAVRRAARDAKLDYQQAVLKRSESQREVNDLLQRKSSWTDNDVLRFTRLVREDHSLEQAEARAKCAVNDCDHAVDTEFSELTRSILARYHEEQVWSDKIRSAATYGQLAVLALNVFVFVLATVAVEPWKRRRLARTFERKVEQLGAQTEERIDAAAGDLSERLGAQEHALMEVTRVL